MPFFKKAPKGYDMKKLTITDPNSVLKFISENIESGIEGDLLDITSLIMLCLILREIRNR